MPNLNDDNLVVTGATLWDGTGADPVPNAVMTVRNGRVQAAGPATSVPIPPNSRQVDAAGKWLLPGLIDVHVHLDEVLTPGAFVLFGITSVRDCGSRLVTMQRLHAAAARGAVLPRLLWLGRNIDEGTPSWSGAVAVPGPKQVPALIDDMVRQGVDGVKLYVNAGADVGCAVIAEAHRRGLPVTGHLDRLRSRDAADMGIDGLEHVFTLFSADLCHDAAHRAQGMRKPYAGAGTADLRSPSAAGLVRSLARRPVALSATMTVSVMPIASEAEQDRVYAGWADIPDGWRRYWRDAYWTFLHPDGWTARDYADAHRALDRFREMLRILDRAGVPILAGTDTPAPGVPPGAGLIHELSLLVDAGLTPRTALLGATGRAAASLRRTGQIGTLTPGAHADFLLLDSSPLADIGALRRLSAVYVDGKIVDRDALRRDYERVVAPPPQRPAS